MLAGAVLTLVSGSRRALGRSGSAGWRRSVAVRRGELEQAIARMAAVPGGSLILPPDPFVVVHLERTAHIARRVGLPTISVYRKLPEFGGLVSYGPDTAEIFRRSAGYVDRIIKGENVAALPAQNPDKFETVINVKTASALGLTIPATLLARADEVIE